MDGVADDNEIAMVFVVCLEELAGTVAGAVAGGGAFHAELFEAFDDGSDMRVALLDEVEAADDEVEGPAGDFPGLGGEVFDAGVGAAGDDNQAVCCLHRQRLLDGA